MRHLRSPAARSQAGATMIEVLVSFVILAFGVMGIAGLQTKVMALNQASLMRSQASALTDDIVDRMRADRVNAMAGLWDTDSTRGASSYATTGAIYTTDMGSWKRELESQLPEATALISVNTTTGVVRVLIRWNDSRGAEDRTEFDTYTRL